MKHYIISSTTSSYLYILKHGIGPGVLPSDIQIVKIKDLPNGYTAVWLNRFLTTDEMNQYDIPYETDINYYLDRIGYCQKNGDVVPCDDVEACGKVTAYSQMSSRRSRSVTKEVLDYLADQYPNSRLYKELVDKDIWINLWSDGEYDLSYNSVKNPETFLTDASADELVKVMNELYPNSFWGDLVDVETCSKVTASNMPRYMANMVNADTDIDEDFDPKYDCKYHADSYYDRNYRGLEDNFHTDDPSELIDWVWDHAAEGGFVEVSGPKGSVRLNPDELAERVEFGDIGEYEIISQIDYV